MILSNKQPIKRLVVRNFKGQKLPEDFELTSWEVLRHGINAILKGEQPSSCLEVLYKTCENMVRCNMGNGLYTKVYETIEVYNKSFAEMIAPGINAKKEIDLLKNVSDVWSTYCERLKMVENVLMYLDRCFVLQRPELISIHAIGVSMFKHYLLEASGLFNAIKTTLLQSILDVRSSNVLGNVSLQKSLVDSGLFGQFEPLMLSKTTEQYGNIIKEEKFGCYTQVEMVAFFLLFEENVAAKLGFPKETQCKLVKIAEQVILLRHLDNLVASGLPVLIEATWKPSKLDIVEPPMNDFGELQKGQDPLFDLRLLVKLAMRANGQDVLKSNWSKFIRSYGSSIISTGKDANMIQEILLYKSRVEDILVNVFNKNPLMENSMKEAFESFINARASRLAELLAKYFDTLLRDGKISSGTDRLPDEQIIELIEQVIVLFRFLQSKDAVEALYKHYLSKRLLQNRTISMDLEKEVVKRFKAECGASFTSRLEGMFKDIDSAPEINRQFRESVELKSLQFEYNITVISSGIWPSSEDVSLKLPKEIVKAQEAFEGYYDGKHNGRRLVWNQSMGYCVIKAPFPQGTKELQVSIPQAVVLECFNSAEKQTFGDLLKLTKLDQETLHSTLTSLSSGRHVVLIKESGDEGKPDKADTYSYNASFTSRLVRIRLNTSGSQEVVEEKISAGSIVQLEDKQHQIDAAIVRTIKAIRKVSRNELIEKSIEALKVGDIPKAEIDKRIDLLITRDFMAKDPEDSSQLIYVA